MKVGTITLAVVAIVIAIAAISATFVVRENEQALVLQFGEPQRVVTKAGLHFKLPIIQDVTYFDRRILDFDAAAAEVPTLDQKQLVVDAFARYRIVDPLLFYQRVGTEVGLEMNLNNIINANLREVFGSVTLARLLTEERSDLMIQIAKNTDANMQAFGVNVVDVRIRRVDLPEENSQAIFRRMQTQREQEARLIRASGDRESRRIRADADREQRVIIAEARRESEILRGQGDAEATRLFNNSYGRDEDFFDFYRSLQALSRGLGTDSTSYVGPPKGDFFRYFNQDSISGPGDVGNGTAGGGAPNN